MTKPVETQEPKQTALDMETELKQIEFELRKKELEEKDLAIKERKANIQDAEERLADRELKREEKRQKSLMNGQTLRQQANDLLARQKRCNHRKGSNGPLGYTQGQGDDNQFAVLKHTFLNGDTWVRCLRCGKTWKPPLEANFYFDGTAKHVFPSTDTYGSLIPPKGCTFSAERFAAAVLEYQTALECPTRNVPSSSYMFRFSDGGKYFREVMNNVTLR